MQEIFSSIIFSTDMCLSKSIQDKHSAQILQNKVDLVECGIAHFLLNSGILHNMEHIAYLHAFLYLLICKPLELFLLSPHTHFDH